MLMPIATRNSIYEKLIQDGVLTAKNDIRPFCNHPSIGVKNLYVIQTLKSLKSRGHVKQQYAWRTYYWSLTNDGITHLREVLHLPPELVPATMKQPQRDIRVGAPGSESVGPRAPPDGRLAFRRGPHVTNFTPGKDGTAVGEGEVHFRGGYGRGRSM